ncbi:GNAT family N-acetyltransferase [Wenxinia marina]|uniref:Wenxma_21, whole genome shotgun sequence n=1 Tax=Wenxinia marina DSM 24838 TaxID=1123501 RepID=A0A0D0Q8T0_9RHOB|nr:GNAT family N-acetyltransferase [Wenxinia marina]KIQ67513.1 Acetyltransferase [Wenxinia marina DSM 24838]GGL68902.1 N-acetyltransferase [Wenxinia marina]
MTSPPSADAIRFRAAGRGDVPAIVALLRDDSLGAAREVEDLGDYLAAFDRIAAEGVTTILVGEDAAGEIVATCHLTILAGLSRRAALRAQVESVRVAASLRGQGIGAALMAEAERRAAAAGCTLVQLTSDVRRTRAAEFYRRTGYEATHLGFKKPIAVD